MLFLTDMRRDVQEIFRLTPHEKQVMMFSATLSKEIRPVCRKFMQDVSSVLQNTNSRLVQSKVTWLFHPTAAVVDHQDPTLALRQS